MKRLTIGNAFQVNPRVSIKRGTEVPFITMDRLKPGHRDVTATETRAFSSGSKFEAEDTLMARITPSLENGKIARYLPENADERAAGSTEFIVLRGKPGVTITDFAYYFVTTPVVHDLSVSLMTGTSGRQRVDIDAFCAMEVAIPDLGTQHSIVTILGALDDKIAANLTAVQKTDALAIALVGMRSQDASQTPLSELTSQISRGVAPKYDDSGKFIVLNQKCIRDSQVDIARARLMKSLPKNPGKVLRQNDVLVNSTGQGTLGRIARWTSSERNTSVDSHVSIVRFDPEVADPAFAGTVLSTMEHLVEDLAEGSTGQTELKRDLLGSLELSLPPLDVQREVGQQIELLDELCRTRIEENLILAKTRDELLPLLMSGKITVKEAEQEATAAGAVIAGEENEA